ncbi:MAG: hypothetical protein CVU05_16010 [Bacteroidetes bacterium HGW-Bacteroidetes-21]|jgi:rubrerythrin|nr:MAG: hypothetical protein CVU05_16010 [Bacteroidetes bacterium HGW-Bacteroidetes-21]
MMENNKTLEILKMAILMEKRGQAFYTQVARATQNSEIRSIFELMAKEEVDHERFLSEQFKNYNANHTFGKIDLPKQEKDAFSDLIITDKIKKELSAASYEAAAISAAIDMENNAIHVYGERAKEATDPEEKALFQWLSDWEKTHHQVLLDIDNELKEQVWNDNHFWPF